MESQATSAFSVDSGVAYGSPSGNIINSYYYSPPLAVGQLALFVPRNGQNSAQYPANNGFPVRIVSVDDTPTNNTNPGAPLTASDGNKAFGFAANQGIQYGNNESYYAPTASRPATPPATDGSIPPVVAGGPVRFSMTTLSDDGALTNALQGPAGLASRAVEAATDNPYYQLLADQNLPVPPSGAPPVPKQLGAKTDTSIPVQFDTVGIAGTQPITYGIYIGTTNPPTGPLIAASVLSGTNFYAVPTGLVPSTQYFICSVADNGVGDPLVSAPLTITTTPTPTNPAPAPGIPYVSPTIPPTATTITIEFDAAGVVGTPSLTLASVLNPGIVPGTATLVSGTIYRSVYTGLSANINYVFQSSAVANVPSGIIYSGLSAPIQTIIPPPAPTGTLTAPVQFITAGNNTSALAVRFDVSAVVGATSYAIYYSPTTTIGVTPYPAQLAIPPSTYQAIVVGLTNNTPYYFWAVASNAGGSLTGPISLPITTDTATGTEPSAPPPLPTLQTGTETSLTFQVDTAGITGTPLPFFLMNLALPGGNPIQSKQAVLVSGTVYDAEFTDLTPGQGYQCQAVAFNGIPNNQASAYTATTIPGNPPSATLTIPTLVSATSTTITVAFDASDVTGTPPISILCRDNGSPTAQSQSTTLISGNTYNATFVGYAPSSDHTFQAFVANNTPPEVNSDFSAPFSTTA